MDDHKKISDALRFCAGGKEPCYSCPLYAESFDLADCQNQVMLMAAEAIEELTAASK